MIFMRFYENIGHQMMMADSTGVNQSIISLMVAGGDAAIDKVLRVKIGESITRKW